MQVQLNDSDVIALILVQMAKHRLIFPSHHVISVFMTPVTLCEDPAP